MKSLLVIALALVSVSSFAADHKDAAHKTAMEACSKEHHGDKAKIEACVTEKTKAPAAEAAPAAAPAMKK